MIDLRLSDTLQGFIRLNPFNLFGTNDKALLFFGDSRFAKT
jgi:hypothetical protein